MIFMAVHRCVIAISGASGVGKTTLAHKVADLLGDAAVLHFDD
jgi:uridine kinase